MTTQSTVVPVEENDLESILKLIPKFLKEDEAGPAFFIATTTWKTETNYEEQPF
jgi:hypothetical protein